MTTWLSRVVSFAMPIVFLTVGSWGLLLAALFVVSLAQPLAVIPTFERLLVPWSAAVAGLLAGGLGWMAWRTRRPTRGG